MLSFAVVTVLALSPQVLDRNMPAIANKAAPGRLGVAIHDIATGQRWAVRGDEAFPLQSVFKVMAGARMLQDVDAGKRRLDEPVEVKPSDLSLYWSPLADEWKAPSTTYPLRRLIELAVSTSDNTAGDLIMRMTGGPASLNAMFAKADIKGIRVDRFERELQPQCVGLPAFTMDAVIDRAKFEKDADSQPLETQKKALAAYLADPRDTSTPNGAVDFLLALTSGKLMEPTSTATLLEIMAGTTTGKNRLKAGLPKGATLAHKTGTAKTLAGVTPAVNDIGIITLKDGRRVAIAVFVSGLTSDEATRERILADVARLAVKAMR